MQTHSFSFNHLAMMWTLILLTLALALPTAARDLNPVKVEPVVEGQSPWSESSIPTEQPQRAVAPNEPSRQVSGKRESSPTSGWPDLYADQPSVPAVSSRVAGEPSLSDIMAAIESIKREPQSQPLARLLDATVLIPIVGILFVFGGPILLVIVLTSQIHRTRERRERQQADTINRLLDAGKDIPVELLRGSIAEPQRNLRKGLRNLGVGVGLLLFLTLFLGIGIGSLGFIIIGLGLSQLAVWKWVDSKELPLTKTGDSQF